MGLWDGLKNAQVFEKGTYFGVGMFDLEVIRVLTKQTQRSGLGFIAEFEVLTTTNDSHAAGSKATWFQSMKSQQTAFSAIKEFIAAVMGIDPKDKARLEREIDPVIESLMDRVTGAENYLGGKRVHLETFMTKTRERGTDFTVHRFTPYTTGPRQAQTATQVAPTTQAPAWSPAQYAQAPAQPPAPPTPVWNPSTQTWGLPK